MGPISTNQPINQSINQSTNQSINHSINQSINQSIKSIGVPFTNEPVISIITRLVGPLEVEPLVQTDAVLVAVVVVGLVLPPVAPASAAKGGVVHPPEAPAVAHAVQAYPGRLCEADGGGHGRVLGGRLGHSQGSGLGLLGLTERLGGWVRLLVFVQAEVHWRPEGGAEGMGLF